MELLTSVSAISDILTAVFVPKGAGAPIHKNRAGDGLAYNPDCTSVYTFENGKSYTCGHGQCIYLPRGSSYTVKRPSAEKQSGGVYAINFIFAEEALREPCVFTVRARDEMLAAFVHAERAWRRKNAGFRETVFSDLYRILALLLKEADEPLFRKSALRRLAPALEYINEYYTREEIRIGFLASLCGVSEPLLRSLFREAFSISPAVYIRNMRLSYARELLLSGEYGVTEAAALAGFNDPSYFSREYKKLLGIPPKDAKK